MSKIKRIMITGAGFSAPANLPIQSRIIDNMTNDDETSYSGFVWGDNPDESLKFLDAYITVGLFLLDNYGKNDYSHLAHKYRNLHSQKNALDTILGTGEEDILLPFINKDLINASEKDDVDFYFYSMMYTIRHSVQQAIRNEKISVNLEDIFTSFDKSMIAKEFLHKYTYSQMDEIRFALTSLFIYYFSLRIQEHDFQMREYLDFFDTLRRYRTKEPTTIITTNWDTLIEGYCDRLGLKYNYGFYYPFTSDYSQTLTESRITLLKVHGSINWLRCLHCGGLSIYPDTKAAASLFSDDNKEICHMCSYEGEMVSPSLQPEIITPTMLKSLSNQVYANIWSVAGRELKKATHITFIGYSFPLADFDFRYMLQKNVPENAEIDVILTQNSNPGRIENSSLLDLLPEHRYREAFPKNKIRFHYDGFGAFFQNQIMTT